MATPTTSLGFQNFFQATLTSDITASSTDIFMDNVPNSSQGFLVIEPDSTTNREVIFYTSKTSLKVTCPSAADGRGQDDTTAVAHSTGATVIMAPVAGMFEALQSGAALANGIITPSKLDLDPAAGYAAATETRANASYGDLTTTTDTASITVGANGIALVSISCGNMFNNTTNANAYMSFTVSGANTQAASDTYSVHVLATGANVPQVGVGATFLLTGLTAGFTTFKLKYRSNGVDVATFTDRRISVVPL